MSLYDFSGCNGILTVVCIGESVNRCCLFKLLSALDGVVGSMEVKLS